jgi:hypothetical protein
MRNLFLGVATAAILVYGGSAFAQSGQGGYLGLNPGGHQTAATPTETHAAEDATTPSPESWCQSGSAVYGRCAGKASAEHSYCMQHDPDHYASCRSIMDALGTNH